MKVFPDLPTNSQLVPCTGYMQMSQASLETCSEYLRWRESSDSGLLFMSGCTAWYGRRLTGYVHCWLSPAAIFIAEEALREGAKVAFFSCLSDLWPDFISVNTLLSSIIIQALSWKPETLRKNDQDFRRILRSTADGSDGGPSTRALVDLLQGVLAQLRDMGTLYIIIDRLDRCAEDSAQKLMDLLARVVTVVGDASFRVKIAVVVETSGGAEGWRHHYLSEYDCKLGRLFVRQAWDQTKLTPYESSLRVRPRIWTHDSAITI
jgi:hypothetical protein